MQQCIKTILRILRNAKNRTVWKRVIAAMAAVVVFVSTYLMVLPAITVGRDTAAEVGMVLEDPEGGETAVAEAEIAPEELQPVAEVAQPKAGDLDAVCDGFEVKVSYGEDAGISESAQLVIKELDEDSSEFADELAMAEKEIQEKRPDAFVQKARVLDITILDGDKEIEPDEKVNVRIKLLDADMADEKNLEVLHDSEDSGKIELIEAVNVESKANEVVLDFETEGFSNYVIVTTRDVAELYPGQTATLMGSSDFIESTDHTWSSSDPSVVTVVAGANQTAIATAVAPGEATITHTYQGKVYTHKDFHWITRERTEYFQIKVTPDAGGTTDPASEPLDLSDYLKTGTMANEWQAVEQRYAGNAAANKTAPVVYDENGNTVVFPDPMNPRQNKTRIRLQKNVVPTGTENEFYVYLSVDKPVAIADLFSSYRCITTTSNSFHGTTGQYFNTVNGNYGIMQSDSGAGELYHVTFKVWQHVDGSGKGYNDAGSGFEVDEPLLTYEADRYSSTSKCSNGTLLMEVPATNATPGHGGGLHPKEGYMFLTVTDGVDFHADGDKIEFNIPMSSVLNQFDTEYTELNKVVDEMGDDVEFLGIEECDGSWSYDDTTRKLTWNPVDNTSAMESYIPSPTSDNWNENVIQMVYKVRLNVTDDKSCAETLSDKAATTAAGKTSLTNKEAKLDFTRTHWVVEEESDIYLKPEHTGPYYTFFPKPTVRGLLYDLRIDKADKLDKSPLEGATFELFSSPDCNGASSLGTGVTDSDGVLEFVNIPYNTLQGGKYYLKETIAPEGYTPVDTVFEVTLSYTVAPDDLEQDASPYADNMQLILPYQDDVKFLNAPIGLEILKLEKGTTTPLKDAEFKLTMTKKLVDGEYVAITDGSVYTGTTDAQGIIKWNKLIAGEYTLSEVTPPTGYQPIADTTIQIDGLGDVTIVSGDANVSLGEDDDIYTVLKVEDVSLNIAIKKIDPKGNPVTTQDVSFLFDGSTDFTGTTDGEGMIYWDFVPAGEYTLKETAHPDDYVPIADCTVTVAKDGTITLGSGNDSVSVVDDIVRASNGRTYHVIQVTNKYSYLDVIPRKADINGANYLSGAKFEIRRNHPTTGTLIGTYTTDSDGYFVSADPHTIRLSHYPDGIYYVTEIDAPDGFTLPKGPWKLVVEEDGICVYPYNPESSDPYEVASITASATDNVVEFTLNDTASMSLPKTGGMGTGLYTTLGISLLIVAGAIYCYITMHRKVGDNASL